MMQMNLFGRGGIEQQTEMDVRVSVRNGKWDELGDWD